MRKLGLAAAAAAMLGLFAGEAAAGELSMPSSKGVYMYGNIQLMTEAAVEATEFGNNIVDVDSNTQAVLTVFLKTAQNSEIAMDLSLVCALWNENVASSKGGKNGDIVHRQLSDHSNRCRFLQNQRHLSRRGHGHPR